MRRIKANANLIAAGLLTGLIFGAAAVVSADDETDDTEIKIQAPLGAVTCDPSASSIAVLGLTIDISAASIESESAGGGDHGSAASDGNDDGQGDDGGDDGEGQGGCAALVAGQTVEVKLASDAAPLTARQVEGKGSGEEGIEIKAPIQAVDAVAQTITVLGLPPINVAAAAMHGNGDDDSADDGSTDPPVDLTQLMAGQFVELQLDGSQLPALVATELHVKNFLNQVEVELDDHSGQEIDDVDDNGDAVDDVDVDVTETVMVQDPAAAGVAKARHRVRKVLHFQTKTHTSFVLNGLPTGRAKIVVTRTAGAVSKARRSVLVKGNKARHLRIRLPKAH